MAALPHIGLEELRAKIENGDDFVLVDALAPMSFARSRLPGAINLPLEWVDDGADTADNLFNQLAVIVRGGSWQSEPSLGMAAKRGAYGTKETHEAIGFRCVCTTVGACKDPWNWLWILKSIWRSE